MKKVVVGENDKGQRLDKFLGKYFRNMPKNEIYRLLRKKRVKVNGKSQNFSYTLFLGDVLELYINDEFFNQTIDEEKNLNKKLNLKIYYEDQNILVLHKPEGIIVHDDKNEKVNTFINQVKAYLYQKGEYDPKLASSFSPSLCHRLDRNTGGVMICAKNYESLKIINEKIKTKEIEKYYICIVKGVLEKPKGTIDTFLFKDSKKNHVYVCSENCPGSKRAVTKYKVLGVKNNKSLIEVQILTGRTHQIRVHFSNMGCPIDGDLKYSKKSQNTSKRKFQALLAKKIIFNFKTDSGILNYLKGKVFKCDNNLTF